MKQNSTNTGVTFKKYLVSILTILSLAFGQVVYAHSVDSYSGTCASGPQYKVTAVVSNVNSSSNYRWQWKNSSNVWVCFVNGANTINSVSYNVSGAVYNLTTNPGPIIFTNPGIGLQGLQIRMVISDGNGVNPCNLPSGNTWTSTNPFTINVSSTSCGPNASIGDRVWWDVNGNGLQDATETGGISGVTVQLRNSANTVIATQTTNASGNYLFTGLAAGTYTVAFPLTVTGGTLTTANVGSNDAVDSDPSATTGITANVVLTANQSNLTVDAGYKATTVKLGNRVWYDTDNDGINDAAENGIRNVTVKLYKDDNNDNVADGASIATVQTDIDGYYTFSNLVAGNYIVGAVLPNGYVSSSVNGGDPDNNTDLDDNGQVAAAGNEIRGLAITLTSTGEPTSGNTNNTYDFGMLPDCGCTNSTANKLINGSFENGTTGWSWSTSNGSLTTGNSYVACGAKNGFNDQSSGTAKVWQDVAMTAGSTVNFSGFAGTHTPGISCSPKLSLIFLNSANAVLSQVDVNVTRDVDINHDQLEQYSLTGVAPANTVKVRIQSSITCNTMKIDAFCLTVQTPPGSIGDRVWEDVNRNGVQDAAEPGIAGVTVTLYNSSNVAIGTTTTNASGNYIFNNLATSVAGVTYQVEFTKPAAYLAFSPVNGAVSVADNNDANQTGRTGNITLTNATPAVTYVDAGMYKAINIHGHVWIDQDNVSPAGVDKDTPAGSSLSLPNNLLVYLIDNTTGEVITATNITNDSFSFLDVAPDKVYRIQVSQVGYNSGDRLAPNPPINQFYLPVPFTNTGEWLGPQTDEKDGNANGELFVPVQFQDVYNANFGIFVNSGAVVTG